MVSILVDHKNKTFYLNKKEKRNLDIALDTMKSSVQDLVLIIDGAEGAGKSVKARQIAYYCAKYLGSSFDVSGVKNIHNDIDKYIDSSLDSGEYAVHILDESRQILNRRRSMGKQAVRFTNYLSECRSKRQVHILVLPAYHDLDSYVTLWRMDMLWHLKKEFEETDKTESGYKLRLGEFYMFPNDNKLKVFYQFKYKYPSVYECRDRFSNMEILDEEGLKAYEHQKNFKMRLKYGSEGVYKVGSRDKHGSRIVGIWKLLRAKYSLVQLDATGLLDVGKHQLQEWDKWYLSDSDLRVSGYTGELITKVKKK